MKKLALLCDYGLDDAIATLRLINHADKFEKIDLVPIAGNLPLSQTFAACKKLLSNYFPLPGNLRVVDTSAIEQPTGSIPEIHGYDGLGDILPDGYDESVPVIEYANWLSEVNTDYTILSLGPCTITEDILKKRKIGSLVLMAGNISEPPNYNGYEFNHGINKDAFSYVVKHPHVAATLDTCHCDMCNLNCFDFSTEGLIGRLIKRHHDMSVERNERICSIYDLASAVYILHPERFITEELCDKDGNQITVLRYISDIPITE